MSTGDKEPVGGKEPPLWCVRILRWFCPQKLLESIEGDLFEQFEQDVEEVGIKIARRMFCLNVLRFFKAEILLRNKFSTQLIDTIMFRSYLTVAYRNLFKNKTFSAINIAGLGIGMAACLLIFQFVTFELSYDKFNDKFDRTYRVTNDRFQNGKLIQHGTIMYPTVGPTMAKDYPEIEEYTRLMPGGSLNIKADDRYFRGDRCHFADEKFLSVFSFPLLAGQRATALKEPYSIVLTESIAKKYFGTKAGDYESALGKLVYDGLDPQPYKVTGILADIPDNSHLQFNALISYSSLIRPDNHGADDSWTWSDMRHYLVLKPGADYKALESKFPAYSQHYFQGDKVSGSVEKFYLQPLKDAHLYSDYEYDIAKRASGKAVWAMAIVAVFILFIAWINYINLTTSRALDRAKEVGLRKVMGAFKSQLIKQFIFESVLISLLAIIVAIVLVLVFQAPFNRVIGGNLSLWKVLTGLETRSVIMLVAIAAAGILLSGFYPAFVLSSYQPVTVLKGKFQHSFKGQLLRKSLVVFQFTASAALITGALVVSQQLRFMNKVDLGIDIHNTLIVEAPERTAWDSTFIRRVEGYKHDLTQVKNVISAATSGSLPGARLGRGFDLKLQEQPSDVHFTMSFLGADHNFLDTYGIKLIAGRKFLPIDHNADYKKIKTVIINEKAAKLLGIADAENAIGKELQSGNDLWRIVGVIHDFHQESLKAVIDPMIILPTYSTYGPTSIKIEAKDLPATVADIQKVYQKYFPDNSFEYSFLEDKYNQQYKDDDRFGKVIGIFTVLAIIISCMGLIGLSSHTAAQRTKEIGIRKVLGASVLNVVSLLSGNFIRLVLFAGILSLPIAYFSMRYWLEGYVYKITLGALLFIAPIVFILLIAAFTISFQVIKTARLNPAATLKSE